MFFDPVTPVHPVRFFMANTKPARGMRDFLPSDVRKRNYVIGIIKEVYESYGFEPLETPAVENIETLMGKYGDEGNQLIFKILKRGEKLDEELESYRVAVLQSSSASDSETLQLRNSVNSLSDLALRYDLTVPLARVVANNKNELPKFFKRYQIQPVWRADRPARGRFREFYQCDVDAIGSSSIVVEAELISAVSEILTRLGFKDFVIRINHREVLQGIMEASGIPREKQSGALTILDKIDKIDRAGIEKEFKEKRVSDESANKLLTFLEFFLRDQPKEILSQEQRIAFLNLFKEYQSSGTISLKVGEIIGDVIADHVDKNSLDFQLDFPGVDFSKIDPVYVEKRLTEHIQNVMALGVVREFIADDESDENKGLTEIRKLFHILEKQANEHVRIDPTLARGLSYYTGTIMEINIPDIAGSLGGGGRYDGLIGVFGKEQIPACGFSLGLERILVVMDERNMFPAEVASTSADVMVTIWNEETIAESLKLANELRLQGLRVLVYPEADKLGKQLKYASQINVPFACILGESEIAENKVTLKNMASGEQRTIQRSQASDIIKK